MAGIDGIDEMGESLPTMDGDFEICSNTFSNDFVRDLFLNDFVRMNFFFENSN